MMNSWNKHHKRQTMISKYFVQNRITIHLVLIRFPLLSIFVCLEMYFLRDEDKTPVCLILAQYEGMDFKDKYSL